MKKKKIKSTRVEMSIGWFEVFLLRWRGRIDGKRGLPKPDSNGVLTSPWIERQYNIYEALAVADWRRYESENKPQHTQADTIEQNLYGLDEKIKDADAQGKAKTITELHARARIARYRHLQTPPAAALEKLYAELITQEAETRLKCELRLRKIGQRLSAYYEGVLRKHPDRDKLPPMLPRALLPIIPNAELTARDQHFTSKVRRTPPPPLRVEFE